MWSFHDSPLECSVIQKWTAFLLAMRAEELRGTLGFLNQTWLFPGPPHIAALLKENCKRAAALTDSWSSCAEIQTSSSAWCRWADRWTETETGPSYRPPFSTEKDRGLGSSYVCLKRFDFWCLFVVTASTTISCLRNVLCGFRIWQRKQQHY